MYHFPHYFPLFTYPSVEKDYVLTIAFLVNLWQKTNPGINALMKVIL